jgi:putative FmdB family regulatory protein
MPIFEYICDDCGEHYERIVMNSKTTVTCPKCESGKHTVQLSVFAAPANGSKSSSGSKSANGSSRSSSESSSSGSGGGCCGGAGGCH